MARQKVSSENTKVPPPEVLKALEFVGLFTRVAKQANVTTSHALKVARGRRTSARVLDNIVREVRNIERRAGRAA